MSEEKKPLLTSDDRQSYTEETQNVDKKKSPETSTKKGATFRELFRYATAWDGCLIFVGSLFSFAQGAGWPVMSIVFGDLTDTFVMGPGGANTTTNVTFNNTFDLDEFNEKMTRYAIYYLYIAAGVLVAGYFQIMCWTSACERQVYKIRKAFLRAILRQEIAWFDKHQSGELTTRLADDIGKMKEGIGDKFSFMFQYLAQFFSGFAIGFWKSWKMTLVMMAITPVLAVVAGIFSTIIRNFSKKEQESYAAAGSVAEEVLSCIRTVISFNGQQQEQKRYSKSLDESMRLGIRKSAVNGLLIGSIMLLMFGTYGFSFWYGSEEVKDYYSSNFVDGMSPGEVLTVFFCVMIGSFSIGNVAPHLASIFGAKGAAAVIFEIIDNKPTIDATSDKGTIPPSLSGDIEFVDVEFTYPTREDVKVLKNFNISIKKGQTVALVGASGCGKSTVVNLIQRMYDVDSGQLLVDGQDVRNLNTCWLRSNIGVVSQEPVLFDFTIAENIKLGKPNSTMQEIEDAARAANAHDFIMQLPDGYNTVVGERGAQLSGGQKQRVAIARALIRNPRILLLDEATSALDSESEKTVQNALDKARLGRTTIAIAHRLSTIQNADLIYVVDNGKIIEYGTHSDLIQKQEFYYELVQAQSLAQEDEEIEEDENTTEQDFNHSSTPIKRQRSRVSTSSDKDEQNLKRQFSRQISVNPNKEKTTAKDEKNKEEEEEEVEKPKYFRIFRENLPECPFIIFGTIASAIQGSTMPLFAIFFGEMIRVFIDKGDESVFWSMMFVALGGGNFLSHFIMNFSFGQSGERLTKRLRLKTFVAYLRQDGAYFDDPKHGTGALTTRLATDASLIKTATGIRVGMILSSFVSLVAALVIAFYYGWKLALVVLGGVPLLVLGSRLQMQVVLGYHKKDQAKLEEAGKIASEIIENIRTVQSLTREKHFFDIYAEKLEEPLNSNLKQAHLYGFSYGFSQAVIFAMYGGAFRFGAWQVSLGDMAPDDVYKVFFAIAFTGMTLGQTSSFLPEYSKAQHSAGLIFKVLDTIPTIDVYSKKGTYLNNVDGKIVFKNVSFNYPTRPDVRVLKSISFAVEPGQTVALVGPSGCGKSTIISLLQRFYDPLEGDITVDGVSVRDLHLARLRAFLSVVSQEPVLFDCSIRDNIAYGLDNKVGMDEVIEAARTANIHEFISELPLGYDTVVGEKGTQLSGGQKQRVAIARALIRNPKILLLDEATSALDSESEKLVQAALDNAQKGRTCIVIAHRLSTIQNCDVIFVIDSGQIVETGTHQTLQAKKGVYSALVSAQKFTQ